VGREAIIQLLLIFTFMEIVTSWDDGDLLDIKMAQLLYKYKLPGIFYIANRTNHLPDHDIYFLSRMFEIGGHTTSHPEDIKLLKGDLLENDIESNKAWLEEIIGREVTSFCYPSGRFNDETVDAVKKAGFKEARTTGKMNTDLPTDLYRINTTIHARPDKYGGLPWLDVAKEQFEIAKAKEHGYYHVWGHSWEVENFKLWDELEELFKYIYEHRN
jgi:peptidoglycan/xylan/chitin deacetylase (PgdA/CDA1 family)